MIEGLVEGFECVQVCTGALIRVVHLLLLP